METVLVDNEKLQILEKLILGNYPFVGQHRTFVKEVEDFFNTTPTAIHETEIVDLLLSFLGGEKMLENNKQRRGVIGDIYDTDIYNSVALIFDHLVRRDSLWLSDLHRFMNAATLQLKTYGDKYHVFGGICQFGYQMLHKMYISILKHVTMEPAHRLHLLGLLCNSMFNDSCDMRWNFREFIADQYLLITEKVLKPTDEQREHLKDATFLWFWDNKKI